MEATVSQLRAFEARSISEQMARWFPAPPFLYPRAAGIDISDFSIKWLVLKNSTVKYAVDTWGEITLPAGIVEGGLIRDGEALADALRELKGHLKGIEYAHVALPEEGAYVFSMNVPDGSSHEQVTRMIEFEFEGRVPIPPAAAVYDFDVISRHAEGAMEEIAVSVFSRELAESYVAAFDAAGITVLSLELEAHSIARAVSGASPDEPITLLVDFGRSRTGFAVLKRGIPIFTSTVDVGGETMTRALAAKLSLVGDAEIAFKNNEGLLADGGANSPGLETLVGTASALADEIARLYHYWGTRRNEQGEHVSPVSRVFVVGGAANLRGLAGYIAGRIQADTQIANVWQRVCSFDDYIPPIEARQSLRYATAIGLALRGV
jgi:type IV pilus assembly protein PilM